MNNTVLVLGAGGSGIHASDLALREGKSVVLYDGNTNLDPEEIQKKISGPVRIVLGELPEEILREAEFAVISPGIPTDIPLVTGIRKAGLKVLSEIEFAWLFERGTVIGINEICPGIIATGMTAAVKDKYDRLIEGGLVPLGRWGQPEDIAKAVVALCDGTFGYTTGTSFIVDGGMHIRKL